MDEIGRLIAEQACTRLILTYASLLDAYQWDDVAALYVPEGRMSRPTAPDDFLVGREAILASFKARPPRISRHICSNIIVTPESDSRALAVSQILLFTGSAAPDGGVPVQSASPPMVGTYQDVMVKTADGWRFESRRGSLEFRPA